MINTGIKSLLSDISGQDIKAHDNKPQIAVGVVRDWLRSAQTEGEVPGGRHIWNRYRKFKSRLPGICRDINLVPSEMIFNDYATVVGAWLKENERF